MVAQLSSNWRGFSTNIYPRGNGAVPRYIGRVAARAFKDAYISTRHGACLHIEPSSLDVYVHILNHGRTWNLPVFEMCSKHLRAGETFYDVGANVGYMAGGDGGLVWGRGDLRGSRATAVAGGGDKEVSGA